MSTFTSNTGFFQRPRLASSVSTMSEFSVISDPMSPVFVEPESDDDEIVFTPLSRAPSTSPLADRRPTLSTAFSDVAAEDDFILITSPRPRTTQPLPQVQPAALVVGATVSPVAAPPAAARVHTLPRDEPPHTPTPTQPTKPLPTSKSTRTPKQRAEPTKVTAAAIPAVTPAKSHKRRNDKVKAAAVTTVASVKAAEAYPSPSPTPSPPTPTPRGATIKAVINENQRHIQSAGFAAETVGTGFGARGVVVEDEDEDEQDPLYNAAVAYVTSYLEDPIESDAKRLPLLQAMLIELGICPAAGPLPQSARSARAMLKSKALINVRDYIAERGHGVDALRKVMFPTKNKLMKNLRTRRVPLPWIKERGLTMFLSHMHFH